ncbi:hypothetical protein WJX72_006015 [[Myrmecia] bisecta]|uniref:Nucleotidyl transferase AbiEii/AbiGii toxin family protein n=1 Tax=[Myrmecia] bisecta TaxID=41462 RepID=A0AAW1PNZ6_9CHLO
MLETIDFDNILVAGGSVLRTLISGGQEATWKQGDFDIFMYGIKPSDLSHRCQNIIKHIVTAAYTQSPSSKSTLVHGRNGVKLCVQVEGREHHFDVVMRAYADPCDILRSTAARSGSMAHLW